MGAFHVPVMTSEVVSLPEPQRGGLYLDCTAGAGGHSLALLQHGATHVIGLDRDPDAVRAAADTLATFTDRVTLVHADYRTFERVLDTHGIGTVDGALADLGVSSWQLDASGRGFSFRKDEPLDMRMDPSQGRPVADLLRDVPEAELARVIDEYGEERHARRVARAIVRAQATHPLQTTGELARVVRRATARPGWRRIDPATRTFQALRIWANQELDGLDRFLTALVHRLAARARAVVLAFHSLEDRIVKRTFRMLGSEGTVRVLTKKPLVPAPEEIDRNPRARSAKLRAVERLASDETTAHESEGA